MGIVKYYQWLGWDSIINNNNDFNTFYSLLEQFVQIVKLDKQIGHTSANGFLKKKTNLCLRQIVFPLLLLPKLQ